MAEVAALGVSVDTSSAIQSLNRLQQQFNRVTQPLQKVSAQIRKVDATIEKFAEKLDKMGSKTFQNVILNMQKISDIAKKQFTVTIAQLSGHAKKHQATLQNLTHILI